MSTLAAARPLARRAGPAPLRLALAATSAAAGVALAAHHPLGPAWALAAFAAVALLAWASPFTGIGALLGLLPLLGLAPWTGWIAFEEFDLLVLAVAAGGHARAAVAAPPPRRRAASRLARLTTTLYLASLAVAAWRGVADAGGWQFDWFAGYQEPLNSLRLAKSFVWACLLVPLWHDADRLDPRRAAHALVYGLVAALAAVSLGALWERIAFTGLLNFSTDYRTTSLFWEMHVGGAAFDGFLALTVPFVVHALLGARSARGWTIAAAVALLAGYACLTTFSRGVYLAVPCALALLAALRVRQHATAGGAPQAPGTRRALLVLMAFVAGAAWLFPLAGYRGVLALLGAVALLLPLAPLLHGLGWPARAAGMLLGLALSGVVLLLALALPKGAYIGYAASFTATAALVLAARGHPLRAVLAFGGFVATLVALGLVAWHWNGDAALERALPPMACLLVAALACGSRPCWPANRRWQGSVLGAMAVAALGIGVFDGGSYMGERFASGEQDLQTRLDHWRQGLDLLDGPADWVLGKGLGRFPAAFALATTGAGRPGDYRLHEEAGRPVLTLTGARLDMGWGELLRVSQRVRPLVGSALAEADVRADQPLTLHFEVCEKHLLYNGECRVANAPVAGKAGAWQHVQARLDGAAPQRGDWYAPRLIAFSIAVDTRAARAEIGHVGVRDGAGELLANGDFREGLARWFFSSDRNHLPWHIKNLFLDLLFDQGAVGLALWLALVGGALWRLVRGSASAHPLAPPLAAAIVGFLVVGLFDSLIDVPRVAFVFDWLLLVSLGLRPAPPGASAKRPAHEA